MKHPNPKMLLRIAQGDAYCMATEYLKFPRDANLIEEALRFDRYLPHPTHGLHKLRPGMYTDDTQMSIAVAETLLDKDYCWSQLDFIEAFVRCFKRDQRDGYARGFQKFLEEIKDAGEFLLKIRSNSDKNGAAMRAVPIGVFDKPHDVMEVAILQAKTTHDTPDGLWSAIAVAMMSHFAIHTDEPFSQMGVFMEHAMPGFLETVGAKFEEQVMPPRVALKTVAAAYHSIVGSNNFLDMTRKIITWGGDTDTVAAIAWGIASARWDGAELPPFFEGGLEDGKYGRDFLLNLGARLMEKYAHPVA